MNTKFELKLFKHLDCIDEISKMVNAHNTGDLKLDIEVFEAYILAKKAIYPSLYKPVSFDLHTDSRLLEIKNNEELLITIEEKQLNELVLNASDLRELEELYAPSN